MTCFIVGCGKSAGDWFNHPHDISIGVQDSKKWGKDPDYLVLIDGVHGFKREPERLQTILNTKAKKTFIFNDSWSKHFSNGEKIRLQHFSKRVKKGHIYNSKTSPFVAASIAFNMGAENIVLFGVDLLTHHLFKPGTKMFEYEMKQYERFARMLKEQGTTMFVSSSESSLSKFLPVWEKV